jgi:hypothetical protein
MTMKRSVPKHLKKALGKDNACMILITCGIPEDDGKMQVEMTCEGDQDLAAFLLLGAQEFIEDEEGDSSPCLKENKIIYLE